jgi:hypothetical protein
MSEAANISQLQNLPLPAPVSYFPQTWGWLALLLMVLGAALFFAGRAWWRWHLNRYRRAALAELLLIENAVGKHDKRDALRQLPDLLKRTALAMPGQPDVASLQGGAWQDFLQRCSTTALPADLSRQLAAVSYAPDQQLQALTDVRVQELLGTCRHWLEQHHVAA